ncbi:MAG: tetratricopeptide repeat protein [Bacteroidota bacterium]|nr:tetratricopeptide repeat protein [Bacteroidota bacterium]MDX5447355.1 tetratricopeptide repeat protein [Bacteroidota bacterium]MDX5506030.1 tetratricopeptide repeat protein [Bacteroidota bacterium]
MKNFLATTLALVFLGIHTHTTAQQTRWESSIIQDYEKAKELYDQQLYASASAQFEQVMQRSDNKQSEVYERAEFYRALSNVYLMNEDGETLMEEFIDHHPASSRVKEGILKTAEYFFLRKRYKQSEEWLLRIDQRSLSISERTDYFFKLGYSQFMREDHSNAKLNFGRILNAEGQQGKTARYYYGHLSYLDSNYNTALEYLEPLKEDAEFGPVIPYYLAQIYYQTGKYDQLEEIGRSLMDNAVASRAPEVARLVGEAYFKRKKYKEAIPFLEYYRDNGGGMRNDDHFQLGYAYYRIGEYARSEESFNKIVKGPEELAQKAYYYLGDSYLKQGKNTEAMSAFKAASEMGEDEVIHEAALLNYAKLSYEQANPYETAIDAFKRFLKKYPDSYSKAEVNRYLANLYLTTKDYGNALEALAETGLNTPDLREAYQKVAYFKGVELFNATQWDNALAMFATSLQYPVNQTFVALAYYWKGEVFYRKDQFQEALAAYETFQKVPGSFNLSEFPLSQYNKGYCLFNLEKYQEAATNFRLFKDSRLNDPKRMADAGLRLGDCYFMTGNYKPASQYYGQYTSPAFNEAPYASFQNALCLGLQGNNPKKVEQLQRLINSFPQSKFAIDAQYELGETYLKMDENQKALNAFTTFRNNFPNSVLTKRALLNSGVIYRNLEQYEKSISTLKEVVEKYPSTPEANEAISFARLVYADANRIDDYVTWVEGISFADVKKASLDTTVYSAAFDQYSLGNCDQAIQGFDNYLKRFPEGYFFTEAHYYRAECALRKENTGLARKSYEQVVSRPRSSFTERSYAQLARLSMNDQQYEQAIGYYEQLISFSEDISRFREANIGLMRAHAKLEHYQKAIQFAEIVLNDDKVSPEAQSEARLIKARSYFAMKDIPSAHQAYEELYRNAKGEPQAEALYHIAYIQNLNGKFEESKETIFKLIDDLPSYQRWRYQALLVLADNYWRLGDAFQANYTLDFIISDDYSEEVVQKALDLKKKISDESDRQKQEQEERELQKNQIKMDSTQF